MEPPAAGVQSQGAQGDQAMWAQATEPAGGDFGGAAQVRGQKSLPVSQRHWEVGTDSSQAVSGQTCIPLSELEAGKMCYFSTWAKGSTQLSRPTLVSSLPARSPGDPPDKGKDPEVSLCY